MKLHVLTISHVSGSVPQQQSSREFLTPGIPGYHLPARSVSPAVSERRLSVRQTECAYKYKHILVKKTNHFTQVILNATSSRQKNILTVQVCKLSFNQSAHFILGWVLNSQTEVYQVAWGIVFNEKIIPMLICPKLAFFFYYMWGQFFIIFGSVWAYLG